MSFPLFISKKYTLSKKDSKFITLISSISIVGIALGVATLIIALSILAGFEKTLVDKIIDFDSQIKISSYTTILPDYHVVFPKLKKELAPVGAEVNPFASKLAIISSGRLKEGVSIKGIRQDNVVLDIKKDIVQGKFLLDDSSIIIGKKLADKLHIKVGDRVTIFALTKDEIPSPENPPNIEQYFVKGIFESGMAEYDDLYAYVSLASAQKLFNIGDNVTGYDIKLKKISKIDSVADLLSRQLKYPYAVRTIYQTHRNIFTWIDLQKKPIPIILGFIILVAVFNIIGTLLMIVLEKTNAVGTLKSLGATGKQISFIFLYQGIFLAIIGIIIGNILAYFLMDIQLTFNIISLPSSVYFMSTVPISLSINTFLGVSGLTLVLCVLASVIPGFIASKINPVSALRFN